MVGDEVREHVEAWDRLYSREGRAWRGMGRLDIPLEPTMRVLDIGCGNGKTTSLLIDAGCSVTAVDYSREAIDICRLRFADEAKFLHADATDIPLPDHSFDLVVMIHVLEHLDADGGRKAVDEAFRLLVPGGRLFIRAFSREDMRYGKGEPIGEGSFRRGNGIVYHYFTEEEMRSLLPQSSCFELVHVRDAVKHDRDGGGRARWELLARV